LYQDSKPASRTLEPSDEQPWAIRTTALWLIEDARQACALRNCTGPLFPAGRKAPISYPEEPTPMGLFPVTISTANACIGKGTRTRRPERMYGRRKLESGVQACGYLRGLVAFWHKLAQRARERESGTSTFPLPFRFPFPLNIPPAEIDQSNERGGERKTSGPEGEAAQRVQIVIAL